jgi:hypothetical protein
MNEEVSKESEWDADKAAHCYYGMAPEMYDQSLPQRWLPFATAFRFLCPMAHHGL